jgi:hypothetical protein
MCLSALRGSSTEQIFLMTLLGAGIHLGLDNCGLRGMVNVVFNIHRMHLGAGIHLGFDTPSQLNRKLREITDVGSHVSHVTVTV